MIATHLFLQKVDTEIKKTWDLQYDLHIYDIYEI